MPKKSKKGAKNKLAKAKDKGQVKDDTKQPDEMPEKERLLRTELEEITSELQTLQRNVMILRQENDFLQQEADQVRIESQEYMNYFDKKHSKRQIAIVTLSDQNLTQIDQLKKEKQQLLQQYSEQKQLLKDTILQKEHQLRKLGQQIDDLQEYKDLQQQQLTKIKELEQETTERRTLQSNVILQLKSNFLKEKRDCLTDSQLKVEQVSRQANQEAIVCLNEHTLKVKAYNRQLRHRLLLLIRKIQTLHEHKRHLQEQQRLLLMEREYARAMKLLRCRKNVTTTPQSDEDQSDDKQNQHCN